ncbi:MAG: hypothetical protein ACKO6Q_05670 [Bacteroidota bacterium]
MFLHRLYKYNRWAGLACSFLLIGFIYLNYKWGLVATPLNQFGMYSGPVSIQGSRTVFQLLDKNGNDLMGKLTFYKRDQVTFYLSNLNYQKSNAHVLAVFDPILSFLRIKGPAQHYGIENPGNNSLENWIRPWLNRSCVSIGTTDSISRLMAVHYKWTDRLVRTPHDSITLLQYGIGQ